MGWDMPDESLHLLPAFSGECSIPGVMGFSKVSSVGQDVSDNSAVILYTGVQSNSAIPVGCHITNSGREYLPQL